MSNINSAPDEQMELFLKEFEKAETKVNFPLVLRIPKWFLVFAYKITKYLMR